MLRALIFSLFCACTALPSEKVGRRGFLYLLNRIDAVRDEVKGFDKRVQKAVQQGLQNAACQSGIVHFSGSTTTKTVAFSKAFNRPPVVSAGMIFLDMLWNKNVRARCSISSITRTAFKLTCGPWADSVLYGMQMSWIAC